jgi:hypothetical protein
MSAKGPAAVILWRWRRSERDSTMAYAQRYVAFVDILGFSDFVSLTESSPAEYDALLSVLREMRSRSAPSMSTKLIGDGFVSQQFSDSIVLSEGNSWLGLANLIETIERLAIELLKRGRLIRGGIAKGLLHHEDSLMFGPAFLEAYRLENTIAKFPRIVLSRQVLSDIRQFGSGTLDGVDAVPFRSFCRLAEDGPAYVHVLANVAALSATEAAQCQSQLEAQLENTMHEPSRFEKVKWFAVYWNSSLPPGSVVRSRQVRLPYQPKEGGLSWDRWGPRYGDSAFNLTLARRRSLLAHRGDAADQLMHSRRNAIHVVPRAPLNLSSWSRA